MCASEFLTKTGRELSCSFIAMGSRRQTQLTLLEKALDKTRMKVTPFATAAGIVPSTLTKFLDGKSHELRQTTEEKIARYADIPVPPRWGVGHEALPFHGEAPLPPNVEDASHSFLMIMQTRSLAALQIFPGDVMEFDGSVEPSDGDVVIADVLDRGTGQTAKVVRQLLNGVLIGRPNGEEEIIPVPLSGGAATISGVLRAAYRKRNFLDER